MANIVLQRLESHGEIEPDPQKVTKIVVMIAGSVAHPTMGGTAGSEAETDDLARTVRLARRAMRLML